MGLSSFTRFLPVVGSQNQKIIIISSIITVVLFALGVIIGFYSVHKPDDTVHVAGVKAALLHSCEGNVMSSQTHGLYWDRYVERHNEQNACVRSSSACWDFGLPRHYIAYHLSGESINIDGKLDDKAWQDVSWSETFVDMRSEVYPEPRYSTKFKMRWDDKLMYVGAKIEEKNLWATFDKHDSGIWQENGFEMLLDVDGSLFNYKQWQINVLGTMLDLMMYKSSADLSWGKSASVNWHAYAKKAVFADGTINQPGDEDKFWSVEVAIPFNALKDNTTRVKWAPSDDEVWFVQFGRSEQNLTTEKGKYKKVQNSTTDWWSWQPCDAINLHLQDRWGLVQFKKNLQDKTFRYKKWHVYKALFDMFDAMKMYKAVHGRFTNAIEELDVPPYLLSRTCVDVPGIQLIQNENNTDFDVSITSMLFSHMPGHIRSDRYVSFHTKYQ